MSKDKSWFSVSIWIFLISILAIAIVLALMFLIPMYNVWRAGQEWKASLMKAEQEKQIQIEQAKAEVESAKLRAEAIKIVWEATKLYPEYRTQEFIWAFANAMENWNIQKIIYVPTEANIPITEARPQ